MPKRILRDIEMATLLVALDHLEEHGPGLAAPDPGADPAGSAYLTYIGEEHASAIAARVAFAEVRFRVPGEAGKSVIVRKVYRKDALVHLLRFCFPNGPDFMPFVRSLDRIDHKYWRVLSIAGVPVPPKPRTRKGRNDA